MSPFILHRSFSTGAGESLVSIVTGLDGIVVSSFDEYNIRLGVIILPLGSLQTLRIITG